MMVYIVSDGNGMYLQAGSMWTDSFDKAKPFKSKGAAMSRFNSYKRRGRKLFVKEYRLVPTEELNGETNEQK